MSMLCMPSSATRSARICISEKQNSSYTSGCNSIEDPNPPGQESAIYLHLNEKGHSFEDSQVRILDREEDWLKRGSCLEITGGQRVARYARPYMALISSPKQICGGVLIYPQWVLTAAHCEVNLSTKVILGSLSQTKQNKDTQMFHITKWIPNKKFDLSTFDNDIQILKLSQKANLDRAVHCMPLPKKFKNIKPGTVCETAGWGKTSYIDQYSSTDLMEVNVTILSNQKCKKMWKKEDIKITKNMLCTLVSKDGKDTCDGDSGGPLICNKVLSGIVSFGDKQCGQPGNASVYTRLTKKHITWIKSEILHELELMSSIS